jgi:Flp pilus assembly pilin Flp
LSTGRRTINILEEIVISGTFLPSISSALEAVLAPGGGAWLGGSKEEPVAGLLHQLWSEERGQDVAEYAVMLAVVLVIVVGTIRLIGANANNVFSSVASSVTN